MQQSLNPWVTSAGPDHTPEEAPETYLPPAAVISAPLRGMVEPDAADRLAQRTMSGTAPVWITGTHGGAGESRIAGLLDGARATDHCWPVLQEGSQPRVLLVCRADMRGLTAARSALTQWASGAAPEVDLLGLAILADAPGKTPKALRDFATIVGGGAPRLWPLPWVEAWRHGDTSTPSPARDYQRFITDITALTHDTTPRTIH
ncbi:hypothetical protein D477_001034 [Arthrobacter crystallopoietes BAB-32]|uniref:Uncharacterized protein n=1 Tax=Arthrobacter crystallopoietes BAB-32 TaxID=1246476 RepID=N1V7T2_9MICC|nr:DUF6668 family protein [Arthrobacter crystallopoietes]EMY36069.1 hypothetical protein D477_001034 [Arthrobacter crystallopoietes BAB-32]